MVSSQRCSWRVPGKAGTMISHGYQWTWSVRCSGPFRCTQNWFVQLLLPPPPPPFWSVRLCGMALFTGTQNVSGAVVSSAQVSLAPPSRVFTLDTKARDAGSRDTAGHGAEVPAPTSSNASGTACRCLQRTWLRCHAHLASSHSHCHRCPNAVLMPIPFEGSVAHRALRNHKCPLSQVSVTGHKMQLWQYSTRSRTTGRQGTDSTEYQGVARRTHRHTYRHFAAVARCKMRGLCQHL